MKRLMTIKERIILITILISLIIGILTGAALASKNEPEIIETISFATLPEEVYTTVDATVDTPIEPVDASIELRKGKICQNPAERSISVIEFETEEQTEAETTEIMIETEAAETSFIVEDITTAEPVVEAVPIYTVDGVLLDPNLQEYAYTILCQFGVGWYYPTFLCQMYQESRFNQAAVSPYDDYGLCQLKRKYHDYFKELAGLQGADLINDPFANIQVGAFLMAHYINQCGDVNTAISTYNTGTFDQYNADYVQQVRQWESTLQRR